MNKQRKGRKELKRRRGRKEVGQEPSRKEKIRARMAASAMASPEELAAVLGVTLNVAYQILRHGKVRAMRLNKRWLIPRSEIARLTSGDVSQVLGADVVHLIGNAPVRAMV